MSSPFETPRIRIVQQNGAAGLLWFGGWLFTIAYVHAGFWKGLVALIAWPYYLGAHFAGVTP